MPKYLLNKNSFNKIIPSVFMLIISFSSTSMGEFLIEQNHSEEQILLLKTIREKVQNNLDTFRLIKMNWTVEKEIMSRDSSGLFTNIEGIWAQDGILQYCNEDAFSNGELIKGHITVIDGKVHKWGSKPDFMSGNITPIEKFLWERIPVTYLGIRLFDSRHSITDVLKPEHACVEDEIQDYNGRPVYQINIVEPEKSKNRAKVYIDIERNMPINIKYIDKHPKTGEDRFICEVKNIELHQLSNGGWFPVSGSRCIYLDDSQKRYDADHIKVDTSTITINREDIPKELFRLDFPDGANVYNEILQTSTVSGQES